MSQDCDSNHIGLEKFDSLGEADKSRLNRLIDKFKQLLGSLPDYLILSPGRVNIIGDHVDYHGFDVLPMAIEKAILCAIRTVDDQKNQLRLFNTDTERHLNWSGTHSFKYGANLHKSHEWQNYILCGYHGVLAEQVLQISPADVLSSSRRLSSNSSELYEADQHLEALRSIDIVVESDLPEASGLSSSSALVCASAMATLLLLQRSSSSGKSNDNLMPEIDKRRLASSCAKYEHLIGTQGGGMDQAVILTARKSYAKHIQFSPTLKCTDVRLPGEIVWLVAHSGVRCPKAASSGFNSRVLETRLGAAVITKYLSESASDADYSLTLRQVKDKFLGGRSTQEIIELLRKHIFRGKDCFSIDELGLCLGLTRGELVERFSTSESFLTRCLNNEVHLLSRCEHVFEEADRVERFRLGCIEGAELTTLGRTMSDSHESLMEKYDCSHPELDRIVKIALGAGAIGARLTGAGWGGCVIVMTTVRDFQAVVEQLTGNCEFLFRSEPQSGCRIVQLNPEASNKSQ